jgi:hypothetical protein
MNTAENSTASVEVNTWRRIKVLRGYAANARYRAQEKVKHYGYVPRRLCAHIPSPFFYSPTREVSTIRSGLRVIIVETSHARYEVFCVPSERMICRTQRDAERVEFGGEV